MKKLTLTLCLIAAIGSLMAGPVDQQKAQQIGAKFLSTTSLSQKNAGIQLQLVSVAAERGATDYYVFNVENGEGFVVVSADDRVKPILAYSTSGNYNPQDVSEAFAFTLMNFQEEIQYVREHNLTATPDITAEWKSVNETGSLNRGKQTRAVVGPLCQTLWNQNYPWNSQCPADTAGSGGHVYAGCVATAMGQVMKFWEWPAQGTGSHTYNPQGYAQQTANFGETEYHFELMPNVLDSTSTEDDYYYIAQFLHHCGIAVDMQYSGNGSGSYSEMVPDAMRNYFRYTCDDHVTNYGDWWPGWGYTNEEWAQMLKDGGLDEGLPLYYSGSDDMGQGGHAYVVDGYDENDYFHYNWGWSGRDNAWCPIGALNTTRYNFNLLNAFIGHVVPNNDTYLARPDRIKSLITTENDTFNGVKLNWQNPATDLNGNTLDGITSVTIRRNFELIAELTDAEVGANMEYEDNNLEPGLYEYAIFVTNEAGISRTEYQSILVGEKCDIVFQLHDNGGNGWKGAAISVTSESGQRIAIVTMTEGSEQTITLPLLKGNLNFIWNHGWYHAYEEHDTDGECSFSILDYAGNELFVSSDLEDGVFLTYNNNCEQGPLTCYPVQSPEVEYVWTAGQFGVRLTWDKPVNTAYLESFYVIRNQVDGQWAPVGTIPFDGENHYEFFDVFNEQPTGDYTYYIRANFWRDSTEESCSADTDYFSVMVTDVEEKEEGIAIYPNPTSGLLNVNGNGTMHISITNLLGQKVMELNAEGDTSIDLSRFDSGFYLIRIETENGVSVQKINLRK